jgi:hypothetical protein
MRLTRNSRLQIKLESEYGVNPGSWANTDAILLRGVPDFSIDREYVNLDRLRGYLGGSRQLVAWRSANIRYETELAPSGTAGTAPAWGKLLRIAGFAEAVTSETLVAYTPVSSTFASATARYTADGVLYTSRGAFQTGRLMFNAGQIPMAEFTLRGFDTNATTSDGLGTNFAAWQTPVVLNNTNTEQFLIGCTYTGATGAISAGTSYILQSLEVDLGIDVAHQPLIGGERFVMANREITGSVTLALTAAQELTWRDDINANLTSTLGFAYGGTAGHRFTLFAPAAQFIDPRLEDVNGQRMIRSEIRFVPSAAAGNDEIIVVSR